jgi:hypothetical protein
VITTITITITITIATSRTLEGHPCIQHAEEPLQCGGVSAEQAYAGHRGSQQHQDRLNLGEEQRAHVRVHSPVLAEQAHK